MRTPSTPSPASPAANGMTKRYVLEVTGEGTVTVVPDKAILTAGAVTEDKSVSVAQAANAKTVSAIVDALLNLGIPKENIQTSQYSIEPQYDFADGKQTLRGYKVTHLLQIELDQAARAGTVMDAAVANGANMVSNLRFTTSHPELYYNQALTAAIRNGQQKASTIAQAIGATLHPLPVQVHEAAPGREPIPFQTAFYAKSEATPIQPGQLHISAEVRMEFSYF